MEVALYSATSLLGKVFTKLSDFLVAAYVDSLELGQNSEQIKAKLLHTQSLLQIVEGRDVSKVPALTSLLEELSRKADEAENLLDELHYFQIHDKLHGTNYATTQEPGPDLRSAVRHQAIHARGALRHTVGSLLQCFCCSCSRSRDGDDAAVARDPRGATNSAAADDDGDELHFDRVSVSRKIKSVLQDMQSHCDIVSDLLGKIPSKSTAGPEHRTQTASTIMQDRLYGRRDTFEEILNRITNGEQTVYVLPIVGPGGIGKTTFTQHLYNDSRVEKHFDVQVWVCVSTDFDVLKLTREILGCIPATEGEESSGVAGETTNLDQLQKSIVRRLKSKRSLLVLDDIWKCNSGDQWKTLLAPFTKGEVKGSMVLVTTRFPKLAEMIETVDSLKLAGLEFNDFFTFFEACIFGDHKPDNYEYELAGIGEKIANKLKGSPLAAKTVGELLHKKPLQQHWNGVLEKHEWLSLENSDDIMPSLKISYDYLPCNLKKCFSYFCLFPENYQFDNLEMNHLFVAVGFADSTHQAVRSYLEQLVDNGFLMKCVADDGHEYYVLHDLMHELSRTVSAEECLNISDLDFRADYIPQSIRHLSVTVENRYDGNFEEEMYKLRERLDISTLRTLMIFREYEERVSTLLKDIFKEINSLRVLFIAVKSPRSFPHRFSKLIHLQCLKIIPSYIQRGMNLPSTLSKFYHLKFLDLRGIWGLPEDFSHLENLHDFRAESELHSNIRNVGKIKHLQRLKVFCVKKKRVGFELRELGALTELKGELIIRGIEHVATKEEATAAKLMLKRDLKELKLLWNINQPTVHADILNALQPHSNLRVLEIADHGGTIGPSWLCLDIWLTSLETLTLAGVSWSTFPPFGKLPNLKVLILVRISGMRQFGSCDGAPGQCFVHLKKVEFFGIPELVEWVAEPNCHSFPSLETIECSLCPNLRVMPFSEVSCTNLCNLTVNDCPKMSLPFMPHTPTLTSLVVNCRQCEPVYDGRRWIYTADFELTYDGRELTANGYGGALALHNMDKVECMRIKDVSHISLTDIEKLEFLEELDIRRCDGLFPEELDGSIVFHSVKSLILDVSHLTGKSWSKVLNCFPALSVLHIECSDADHDYEECVVQFPTSSSLQTLCFSDCKGLILVPVENGGGIQEDNSSLQSIIIYKCGKFLSRWPMGEAGGGARTIYPFPASVRELGVEKEPSMKSMSLLSNLTSLTSLGLVDCDNLTVDGFNPLITVNLKALKVKGSNTLAADMLSEVARSKLLPAGYISRLEELTVDNISGLLVAPICNFLTPALHTLVFSSDGKAESFTEEQEKALQLLTSLQRLQFLGCEGLQSLPQGLHRLSSLEQLNVFECPKIQSIEGLPVSLRKVWIYPCSAEINEQSRKIKWTNPDIFVTDDYF